MDSATEQRIERRFEKLESEMTELKIISGRQSLMLEKATQAYEKFSDSMDRFSISMAETSMTLTKLNEKIDSTNQDIRSLNASIENVKNENEKKFESIKKEIEAVDDKTKIDLWTIIQSNTVKVMGLIIVAILLSYFFDIGIKDFIKP